MRMKGGYLSIINSDFADTSATHIELGDAVRGASILGNRFAGGARIMDNTDYPVTINHTPLAVDPLPAYDYRKPARPYRPAKTNLYVVTEAALQRPGRWGDGCYRGLPGRAGGRFRQRRGHRVCAGRQLPAEWDADGSDRR